MAKWEDTYSDSWEDFEHPEECWDAFEDAGSGFDCHICGKFINNEKIETLDGVFYCIQCKYKIAMGTIVREDIIAPIAEIAMDNLGEHPLLDIFNDVEEDMMR